MTKLNKPTKQSIRPPFGQFNGHIQTIFPSFFRKIELPYTRERLELPDGDFLDLDWLKKGSKKLIIVTHGLEGDSSRPYVTGMIKKFSENGFDGLGWNCRSCSGEINRLPRFYHHGDAEDLRFVLAHAIDKHQYQEIVLVGFSMGGSLTLRLLATKIEQLPKEVKRAFVASVPLDLYSSVLELDKFGKRFYMHRFIRKLAVKIESKSKEFPDNPLLNFTDFKTIKNFVDFDNRYTAPLHGYTNALQFYKEASTKPLLNNIQIPTKIIQALNDPFLGEDCLNLGDCKNENVELILCDKGGHVGFMEKGETNTFVENLALKFSVAIAD